MKRVVFTIFLILSFMTVGCMPDNGPSIPKGDEKASADEGKKEEKKLEITSFTAEPGEVEAGSDVEISWEVKEAEKIYLYFGPTYIASNRVTINEPKGSKIVKFFNATELTIEAIRGNEPPLNKTAEVSIKEESEDVEGGTEEGPQVQFTASSYCLHAGDSTSLTWEAENADSIQIYPSVLDITNRLSGSVTVAPSETTIYTLSAIKYGNDAAEKSVTIRVVEMQRKYKVDQIISRSANDIAFVQGYDHFYLATGSGIVESQGGETNTLDERSFTAVAVDRTNSDHIFAGRRGIVYFSEDGGENFSNPIPVIGENVNSLAAKNGKLIIGTDNGIYYVNTSGGATTRVSSVSNIKKVFATTGGFFAATEERTYYSSIGSSGWRAQSELDELSLKYIFEVGSITYAITSGGGFKWGGNSWEELENPPPGDIQALDYISGLGFAAITSSGVWIKYNNERNWEGVEEQDSIPPSIKGLGISESGIFIWTSNKVYEGKFEEYWPFCPIIYIITPRFAELACNFSRNFFGKPSKTLIEGQTLGKV